MELGGWFHNANTTEFVKDLTGDEARIKAHNITILNNLYLTAVK